MSRRAICWRLEQRAHCGWAQEAVVWFSSPSRHLEPSFYSPDQQHWQHSEIARLFLPSFHSSRPHLVHSGGRRNHSGFYCSQFPISSARGWFRLGQTRVTVPANAPSWECFIRQKSDFPVRVSKEEAFGFGLYCGFQLRGTFGRSRRVILSHDVITLSPPVC